MLKQSQNPYGYRNLLAYKKAEELQSACSKLTQLFPKTKTLIALADQMDRSARSTKQNITEGWKRNTTNEYYQFLGFAIASNAELEEDFTDIWKGFYPELMGIRGIMGGKDNEMGEMGEKGIMGEGEKMGITSSSSPAPSSPLSHSAHLPHFDIEKIPFYPIDPHLPLVVQLKLRAKELNFLLDRLQKSLSEKMGKEGTLSVADKFKKSLDAQKDEEKLYEKMLAEQGLMRLKNGKVVKREEWDKMEQEEKGGS